MLCHLFMSSFMSSFCAIYLCHIFVSSFCVIILCHLFVPYFYVNFLCHLFCVKFLCHFLCHLFVSSFSVICLVSLFWVTIPNTYHDVTVYDKFPNYLSLSFSQLTAYLWTFSSLFLLESYIGTFSILWDNHNLFI